MKKEKRIYLDHAATTPLDARVSRAMRPYIETQYGNPGGLYREGVEARNAVEVARKKVAHVLGARAEEVVFTGSGTEANNIAILGYARMLHEQGMKYEAMHCVTSVIEHSSVLEPFRALERKGVRVSYVGVTEGGVLNLQEFRKSLRPDTVLVSIMYANNEIGTIQPMSEIRKIIFGFRKSKNTLPAFHIDACNVGSFLDLSVLRLGADMLTLDAQKIYGPKGVGVLYIRKGVHVGPLLYGGGQERGLRAGTEYVAGIVGMAEALTLATVEREKESKRLTGLRDYFIEEVRKKILKAELNGALSRLPNNVNFSFSGFDNEWLTLQLDARGIAVGTKSACLSEKGGESYVVKALGKGSKHSKSTLRFTFGKSTTKKDLDFVIQELVGIIGV